ncbi:MAG: hypothetical protein ACOCVH_01355 [Verrucomicrobiota bacterium]
MNKEVVDFIAFTRWVKESLLHFEPQGVADFAACLRARAGKHLLRYKGFGIVTIAKALKPCSYSKLSNCRI